MTKLSHEKRARIAALGAQGASVSVIMREVGCARSTALRWKDDLKSEQPIQDKPRPGRPQKLTPTIRKRIVRLSRGKLRRSTRVVAKMLKQQRAADLSHVSVRKALCDFGAHPYHRPKRPKLLEKHKKQRRAWLRSTNNSMWGQVVFSDEKIFQLVRHPNTKNDVVWALSPSEVPPAEVVQYPVSVHVWGAICARGKTKLAFIDGTLNAPRYQDILDKFLLPTMNRLYESDDWKFMQDHAKCHDAKSTQAWLADNVPDFFDKDSWPAKSPDMNPIENLWSILEDKINRKSVKSKSDLQIALRAAWNKLDQDTIQSLIDSMPARRAALRKAQGSHTKY